MSNIVELSDDEIIEHFVLGKETSDRSNYENERYYLRIITEVSEDDLGLIEYDSPDTDLDYIEID